MTLFTAFATGALLLPVLAIGAAQAPSDEAPSSGPSPGASRSLVRESDAAIPATSAGPGAQPGAVPKPTPVGRWTWPLTPSPQLVRAFAIGPAPWSPGHRGVDLRPGNRAGAVVRAPASGRVRFTGVIAGRPVVSLDHGGGLISSFEPVIGTLRRGQAVQQGDVVGVLNTGPSHCLDATCLHWGVRKDGQYINPLLLIQVRRGPAVLLPMVPP